MAAKHNLDPSDKDQLGNDLSVSTPPPKDLITSSTPVPPLRQKYDCPDPVPKEKPPVNPDKEECDPDDMPTKPGTSVRYLPEPCPVPTTFSRKTMEAIEKGALVGNAKIRLLREAGMFYFGVCSGRCSSDYITIAKTLCREYPQLRDKMARNGEYWVSNCCSVE